MLCQLADIKENDMGRTPHIIREQSGRLILELEEIDDHFLRLREKTSPSQDKDPHKVQRLERGNQATTAIPAPSFALSQY